jgi:hypothetical protein
MKVLLWLVGVVAVVAVLFIVVFPWFNARFVTDPVLETGAPTPAATAEVTAPAGTATPFQPTPLGEDSEW